MKESKVIYDPHQTIEEMATASGVSVATVRRYIKLHKINRQYDKQRLNYDAVRSYYETHPNATYQQVATALNLAINTVRKYANMSEMHNNDAEKFSMVDKKEITQSILSVGHNQSQIIANIVRLHLNGAKTFDCDLSVSKGGFYLHGTPRPPHCFDKYPRHCAPDVRPLEEAEALPDEQFCSIIIDLPTIIEGNLHIEGSSARFIPESNRFKSINHLIDTYKSMIGLANRLLKEGGKLVFKTKDLPTKDGQLFASIKAINIAQGMGLKLIDNFIQILKLRPKRENVSDKTARVAHCYYLVFQKG